MRASSPLRASPARRVERPLLEDDLALLPVEVLALLDLDLGVLCFILTVIRAKIGYNKSYVSVKLLFHSITLISLPCNVGVVALRDVLHEALLELVLLRLVHALDEANTYDVHTQDLNLKHPPSMITWGTQT